MENGKIVVVGKTYARAVNFLGKLLIKIPYGELSYIKGSPVFEIGMKTGATIVAYGATNAAKGLRCEKAYVDSQVDSEFINNVLRPFFLGEENIEYFDIS